MYSHGDLMDMGGAVVEALTSVVAQLREDPNVDLASSAFEAVFVPPT
eukprot:NODE_6802_length_482_cov_213.257611.p3 GENE.NODE_6802_length_482_cov_213.257611~~NODE_6802_length_482_cov_213.257611.p3  ORF type:complete len:54 (+),score=12.84 NODE_6802_length_482_cov_213.257611:22-162(+)